MLLVVHNHELLSVRLSWQRPIAMRWESGLKMSPPRCNRPPCSDCGLMSPLRSTGAERPGDAIKPNLAFHTIYYNQIPPILLGQVGDPFAVRTEQPTDG